MQPIEQNQHNVPQRAHSSPHININRPQPHRALLAMTFLITIALCITLYLPASTTVRAGPPANFSVSAGTAMSTSDTNPNIPSKDTGAKPEMNRKPFGDYPYRDNVQTIEDLKRGVEAAAEVLGSGGRHWEGGGVTGPSETQVKQQFDKIFRIILSKLDVTKYQLHSVKPLSCVVRHEHFALPPMKHSGGRKKSKKAAPAAGVEGFETLSSHFMHLAIESLAAEGAMISSDCSITLPPLWIASCLLYAFSTMRGEDYLLFSGNSTQNSPSIFIHLRRFKDSQCARFMTCGLWTSGQITSASTDVHGGISDLLNQNPAFAKATSVLLGHFGAHMANLKEIDKLLATKTEILYSSRPSDVSPILVTHRTTSRLGPGPEDTSDLFDKSATEHSAEPLYASFDPIGERLAIGTSRNADPKTTVTLPQMSSETVFLIFRMVAAPRPSAYGLPKLIAFLGDSVERANYFALVSSLRRGKEYLKDSSSAGWSSYAAWSTSGMYDGRTLLVVFEDCDFLMSHFVYPFMNADENGNGPMESNLRDAIEAAVQQITDGNSASYAKDKVLRYTTRDIIRSVLSPFRTGPSQVLQLGTLRWYLSILNKLCEADPTPTRLLCPRLLLYFEFDMKADLPNVALLQEDGGEMFMDLWKTQTCRGKAVPNKALRNSPTIDEADATKRAHHIRWDESARSVVSLGLVMTSFGFWDHAEPVIVSRLHAMMATDFGAMLAGSPSASSDTIYMHRISTLYHHQKGRDRPYYEAFRKAYLEEGPHTFNDVSTVRQDVDADTKSSTWTALSRNFSFRAGYGSTSSKEELPGLWMTFNRKGKAISPFQDYVLTPERRTRDAVALPNRDKNIPPLRMMMQVEKMLVEGWASLLHLSKLAMHMAYNILNIRPLPQLPHSLAGKAVPSDPVDQTQLLFDQYRYTGDAFGSVIGYSNSQRNEVLSIQSTQLIKTCPISETQSSHQPQKVSPPNLWAFDASLVQTLYPFTGTDIVHTDCHFNLNARRTERVRTSHSDGHVLMSEWGLTALFTSLHPLADDDGYVDGEPATSPTNSSKKRWSTVQPVCVDDSPPEAHVTSVEVAVSLERRFFRLMYLNYGCEGNWTINQAYRANATQPSLVDETLYPLAPPECSVLIGQTLHQCRNVMAESENYLRLLHILRVKSSSP